MKMDGKRLQITLFLACDGAMFILVSDVSRMVTIQSAEDCALACRLASFAVQIIFHSSAIMHFCFGLLDLFALQSL